MTLRMFLIATLSGLCVLSGCASGPEPCETGTVRLTQTFSGAPQSHCERLGPAAFRLSITPEDQPINPSPWYAFDLEHRHAAEISVVLEYGEFTHRYHPKQHISEGAWVRLSPQRVQTSEDSHEAQLLISSPVGGSRVAAQEVFGLDDRARWRTGLATMAGLDRRVIGTSEQGRSIEALVRPGAQDTAPLIIILGGQHPPEVTGVLGLRAFAERLFIQSDPAETAILDQYHWIVIPDLNPDGVESGYWRHNTGHTDLNRDWGLFEQAETRSVQRLIQDLQQAGHQPFLMLDFHSTRRDVLYTPPDDAGLTPANFSTDWLVTLNTLWDADTPTFARSANHNPDLPTSKTWFAETYGAPALTVEFGDETERTHVSQLASVSAEALIIYLSARP